MQHSFCVPGARIGCDRSRLTWSAWLLSFGILFSESTATAQTPSADTAGARREPVRIFLECEGIVCDQQFLQSDIMFVTHVRDRHDADVHVLLAGQLTAEGGTEVTVRFLGQKEFADVHDSLRYVSRPGSSVDRFRVGLSNTIKRGLVQYVNRTSLSEGIIVGFAPSTSSVVTPTGDRWHRWTFSTAIHGLATGEQLVKSTSFGLAVAANRTTDALKINMSVHTQYDSATYHLDSTQTVQSVQRSFGLSTLAVAAVNDHVSVGGRTSALHSPFLNQALTIRVAPAFEFNVFQYRESARRMLTVEYSLGAMAAGYEERTVTGKTSEKLLDHRLLVSLRLTQPWGSAVVGFEGANYLHDWKKHRITIVGSVDWNLAKGLALSTSVDLKRIGDQLFLAARGASAEEILLRRRQLTTSYTYSAAIGIRYTFGSPLAQVVNRRFGGTIGTMTVVQ